jgi:hypothetical protein
MSLPGIMMEWLDWRIVGERAVPFPAPSGLALTITCGEGSTIGGPLTP